MPDTDPHTEHGTRRQLRETGSLVGDALQQVIALVRGELNLLRAEMDQNARKAVAAIGMIVAGIVVMLVALNVLAAALVEAIASLGYSEPGSGSDVAAAQTRAVRMGDDWVLDGQKMFTSGANLGDCVFLLARTNADVQKHKGLTLFLVPLDQPGVEVRPFETLSDEKTNATYYSGVHLPDRYRVGEVDDPVQGDVPCRHDPRSTRARRKPGSNSLIPI